MRHNIASLFMYKLIWVTDVYVFIWVSGPIVSFYAQPLLMKRELNIHDSTNKRMSSTSSCLVGVVGMMNG